MKNSCIILIALLFVSCVRYFEVQESDLQFIPYEGNEILVFQSDLGRMDTISLQGIEKHFERYNIYSLFPVKFEAISLSGASPNPSYEEKNTRSSGCRVEIEARKHNEARVGLDITLKNALFYGYTSSSLTQFKNMPNSQLKIAEKLYTDVKIFEAAEESKQYYMHRENYVERFYWSVSEGFLGLDKRDEKWRLVEKYTP